MSFNFSKPEPIKTNEKKVSWMGKIWAGINLVSLFATMVMPKSAQDNIPVKWRNAIILIFVLVLVWFIGSGVYINSVWAIDQVNQISFSLGDGFYYFGFVAILFIFADLYFIQERVYEIALEKKILINALENLGQQPNPFKGVSGSLSARFKVHKKAYHVFSFASFIWVVWGILFHETILFGSLIATSMLFSIAQWPIKKVKYLALMVAAEIITAISIIVIILFNHFIL